MVSQSDSGINKKEDGIETKTFSETARDIMGCMGISSGALKNKNGRYEFWEKGHAFLRKALANYSKDPYASIRSGNYDKVPLSITREFMDMVVEAMGMSRKPSGEIQKALLHIDNTVGYSARLSKERLESIVMESSQRYIDIIDKNRFLLYFDRIHILDYVEKLLFPRLFDEILKKVAELAEYLNDTRLSEVQDASLYIDQETIEKMIAAFNEMRESEDEDEDDSCPEAPDTTMKLSNKADISAKIAEMTKLNEEKRKKLQAIHDELNISSDEHKKYDFVRYRPSKEVFEEALEEIDKEALMLQRIQKHGESGTGKSQLSNFLRNLLENDACFALNDISQLGERWTTGSLLGKLLCICGDVPNAPLTSKAIGTIKQLTGDDLIRGEFKYQNAFTFENTAKLLFVSNYPLQIPNVEMEQALLERLVTVPCRYPIPQDRQILHLHKHLLREAGYIVELALEALDDLINRNGIFTSIAEDGGEPFIQRPKKEQEVRSFVHDRCLLGEDAACPVGELFAAFKDYTPESTLDVTQFSKHLMKTFPELEPYRTKSARFYQGILLKE